MDSHLVNLLRAVFSRPAFWRAVFSQSIILRAVLLACLTLLCSGASLRAQDGEWISAPPRLHFEPWRFGGEQDPPQVRAFLQDPSGFLWLGTEQGLERYNGYDVEIFPLRPEGSEEEGLAFQSAVIALTEDPQGTLWAATEDGRVVGFDPAQGSVSPSAFTVSNAGTTPTEINALLLDSQGTLWVGTSRGLEERNATGSVRYHRGSEVDASADGGTPDGAEDEDPADGDANDVGDPDADDSVTDRCRLGDGRVTALVEDSQGTLWVGTRGGLYRFDRVRSCFEAFRHDPTNERSLASDHVSTLLEDSEGTLWVGTEDAGLDRMLGGDGKFFHLRASADDPLALPHNRVAILFEDSRQQFWVGTEDGLSRLDRSTGRFDAYGGLAARSHGLPRGAVRSLFEDREGTLWVSTETGVTSLPALGRYIEHYAEAAIGLEAGLRQTLAIYEDLNGRLWLGTAQRGLFVLDRQRRRVHHYLSAITGAGKRVLKPAGPSGNSEPSLAFSAITGNGKGAIWLATDGAGVWWRSSDSTLASGDRLQPLPHDGRLRSIDDASISALEYADDTLWIGTEDRGLYHYDTSTRRLRAWSSESAEPVALTSLRLKALCLDGQGDLWVGTADAGIDRIRAVAEPGSTGPDDAEPDGAAPLSPAIESWGERLSAQAGPRALRINDLLADEWGVLWMATEGGLLWTGEARQEINVLPSTEGRSVKALAVDQEGNLWATGLGVLWRFPAIRQDALQLDAQAVELFTVAHGLQGEAFSAGAVFAGRRDAELFFGGEHGINVFSPHLVALERPAPTLVLTRLTVEGQVREPLEGPWNVVLDSDERSLEVEVAALDFVRPEANRYGFFLEGHDLGWVENGSLRRARYGNLAPGHYTLHIGAAHADGVWNRDGLRLAVEVQPTLRQRPSFQIFLAALGALVIGLLVLIWDRARNRRQVRLRELEIEGKERQLGAQESERSRLASDIQQGALTVLPALITELQVRETLGTSQLASTVSLLQETTHDLEGVAARLHSPVLGRFGLSAAIRDHLDRLRREYPRLEVQLDLAADGQRLSETVRLALYRIFAQALDNALRHGDPSWIRVAFELSASGCRLRIIDDGRGFRVPLKWIQLLRGKYQGLLDMVERAESLGGRCHIRSVPGRGTEVRVIAPFAKRRRRR